MEEISSRRSSTDEYSTYPMLEPAVHDVMSLEMSHHNMGGNYLDPRSFGGATPFDGYGDEGSYDVPPSSYETTYTTSTDMTQSPQQHQQQQQQQTQQQLTSMSQQVSQHLTQNHYSTSTSSASQARVVPTYPVKTADPSTCSQYAPVRTIVSMKPPPRRSSSSRSSQKKEPLDPKKVEDEVARNVSQILSATKQQQLAQEAQQRNGILPTTPTRNQFSCPDCGKSMTSQRNLQRHRQSSCSKRIGEWLEKDQGDDADHQGEMYAMSSYSSYSESSGWCSPTESYSMMRSGRVDSSDQLAALDPVSLSSRLTDSCLQPLCLDTDDSQTLSSSASHCSSGSNNGTPASFTCESCKKSVCSLRSLKRHYTTCKQYLAEFGPPPDADRYKSKSKKKKKTQKKPEIIRSSPSPDVVSSTQDEQDADEKTGPQKNNIAHNTCLDCNRQLCSASNLKRHRATCKMANSSGTSPPPVTTIPISFSNIEIPARERSIIDRSYAAAVAASEQERQRNFVANGSMQVASTSKPLPPPQNFMTVGEHLRAKQMQQKLMEAGQLKKDDGEQEKSMNAAAPNPKHERPEPKPGPPTSYMNSVPIKEAEGHSLVPYRSIHNNLEIPPLDSIITSQPINGDRVTGVPVVIQDRRPLTVTRQPANASSEFQCPECKKTYSCRKNVKRHRMAVHKLTADDVAKYPGPTPSPHAVNIEPLSTPLPSVVQRHCYVALPRDTKIEQTQSSERPKETSSKFESTPASSEQQWEAPRPFMDAEEETARIAAELKRSAEETLGGEVDEKRSRTELAEADTTFDEDEKESHFSRSHHSSPGSSGSQQAVSSTHLNSSQAQSTPVLTTWTSTASLSLDMTATAAMEARSTQSSPGDQRPSAEKKSHVCDGCHRSLSSDYSLRRHRQSCTEHRASSPLLDAISGPAAVVDTLAASDPLICHGPPSSASRVVDEEWFKREDIPDSTTQQRFDRSTSPGILMENIDHPAPGNLPYTRQRAPSGGQPFASNDPKQARHLCQSCGKFYSSEWNLERHRRESCPTKGESPSTPNDDVSITLGNIRFLISRAALQKASTSFVHLFNLHDPTKGELRLDGDPLHFQMLLDVYNNPTILNPSTIDSVASLAVKLKFNTVFDCCTRYIAEELPKFSVMHAIRLAEQFKMTSIKQKLFDSISIDVFRSLSADHDYKLMNSELKAELLEKWGTFL